MRCGESKQPTQHQSRVFFAVAVTYAFAPAGVLAQDADEAVIVPTIRVSASADRPTLKSPSTNGALGTRSELDTPFSLKTITNKELEERQTVTLADVFQYDASSTSTGSSYGGITSSIAVRGGTIDQLNGYKIDGLTVPNWKTDYPIPVFEEVQLLKGASGFMYGFGSPGGIINYVSKRPTDKTTISAEVGYRSAGIFSGLVDAGGRAGPDERFGYRMNAYHEEGQIFNGGHVSHDAFALALDARLTKNLKLTLDGLYQNRSNEDIICCVRLGSNLPVPRPASGRTRLGASGSDYGFINRIVTTGLEWEIAPEWKLDLRYRHADQDRNQRNTLLAVTNAAGDYADILLADLRTVKNDQVQVQAEGKTRWGGMQHQLVFGASSAQTRQYLDRNNTASTIIGRGNLYTDNTLFAPGHVADQYEYARYTQNALFVSDTISLTERWQVLAGLRYTSYKQDNFAPTGTLVASYKKNPLSPTVALIFKPEPNTSVYASYVDALEASGGPSSTNVNRFDAFGPLKSKQYELGVKTERRLWNATAALFRVERDAEYSNAANYFVQDGKQRNQGVEVSGAVSPVRDWTIAAGVMYLDATYEKALPQFEGNRLEGRSRWVATMDVKYQVPALPGLNVRAGAKYVGSNYADVANTQRLPSYTTFDLGASYRTKFSGYRTTLNAVVKNLTDKRYWSSGYQSSFVAVSEPRTLSISARVDY